MAGSSRGSTVGVILAGGRSSRMGGGDKPLLQLAGKPLLAHLIDRLSLRVDTLAINANGDPARFGQFGLPVLADSIGGYEGPLAGILSGLEWAAAQKAEHLLTAAGDTPFFPHDLAARLRGEIGTNAIAVASSNGRRHPVFALWRVDLRADLRAFITQQASRKVVGFIDRHQHVDVDFAPIKRAGETFDPFFNINTQAELAEAHRLVELDLP